MTQILVSMAVVGEAVVAYMPYMLLAGGLAGVVTGVICHFVVAFAERNSLTLRHRDVYVRVPAERRAHDDAEDASSVDAEE